MNSKVSSLRSCRLLLNSIFYLAFFIFQTTAYGNPASSTAMLATTEGPTPTPSPSPVTVENYSNCSSLQGTKFSEACNAVYDSAVHTNGVSVVRSGPMAYFSSTEISTANRVYIFEAETSGNERATYSVSQEHDRFFRMPVNSAFVGSRVRGMKPVITNNHSFGIVTGDYDSWNAGNRPLSGRSVIADLEIDNFHPIDESDSEPTRLITVYNAISLHLNRVKLQLSTTSPDVFYHDYAAVAVVNSCLSNPSPSDISMVDSEVILRSRSSLVSKSVWYVSMCGYNAQFKWEKSKATSYISDYADEHARLFNLEYSGSGYYNQLNLAPGSICNSWNNGNTNSSLENFVYIETPGNERNPNRYRNLIQGAIGLIDGTGWSWGFDGNDETSSLYGGSIQTWEEILNDNGYDVRCNPSTSSVTISPSSTSTTSTGSTETGVMSGTTSCSQPFATTITSTITSTSISTVTATATPPATGNSQGCPPQMDNQDGGYSIQPALGVTIGALAAGLVATTSSSIHACVRHQMKHNRAYRYTMAVFSLGASLLIDYCSKYYEGNYDVGSGKGETDFGSSNVIPQNDEQADDV